MLKKFKGFFWVLSVYVEFKEAVKSINNKLFSFQDMLTHSFKLNDANKL
ncbi:MAG: hypothetical protein CM1200mP13_17700 [Candidatus Pelagibacterales bacterium]|nr:MAG: hypothetical protein CM1200mP13_17700 [Pelagibacterales bacterium]